MWGCKNRDLEVVLDLGGLMKRSLFVSLEKG
jgi:hypothetical protein